jgi:uncharacterized protein YjbJ (UPF0337 family)
MNTDKFAGTTQHNVGRIEEAVGAIIDDRGLQAEGIIDQVKGTAQNLYGDARDKMQTTYERIAPATRDGIDRVITVTRDHSLLSILAAGAVGFALAVAFRNTNSSPRGSWSA